MPLEFSTFEKNGDPAYNPPRRVYHRQKGMSLRDFFAAHALVGMLSYSQSDTNGNWTSNSSKRHVAENAYEYADAMLAARQTKESSQ